MIPDLLVSYEKKRTDGVDIFFVLYDYKLYYFSLFIYSLARSLHYLSASCNSLFIYLFLSVFLDFRIFITYS